MIKKSTVTISNAKKTRFKLTIFTDLFFMGLAIVAVKFDMESLASVCVGAILTVTTSYIAGNSWTKAKGMEKPLTIEQE